MHRILVPAALTLLLASACAPLIELEDENTALRSKVDSLEIVIAECRGQGDLLQERLTAIETENLQLDDRNRELSARVVEIQYADSSGTPAATAVPHAEIMDTPAGTSVTGTAAVDAAASGDDIPSPHYDGKVPAGLEFLRQYQAALNAYNGKQYAECARMFTALLAGSGANDMTDNCVYWLGEAAVQQGQSARAIELFSQVIRYRGADKIDDALISRAAAHIRAGNKPAAREDLDRLLREYPDSEHIGPARQMLRNLQ
ncbi:MAG: tetratricopeptide repeat protein [Bacteroidota bacterium]|jgi:TolA-binding protein